MKLTVVSPFRVSNISIKFFVAFFCVILIPSINGQGINAEYNSEAIDKKSGSRPFINPNDKRGGGRYFQLKRGGARSFSEPVNSDFHKRGGARGFATPIVDADVDKRGGARGFATPVDSDLDKRGGGRGFIIPLADKREDVQDIERRAGARAFSIPLAELDKRGGARPFYAVTDWKRGGGRSFSNFYEGGSMKRNSGQDFQAEMDKRGGGRGFQVNDDIDKRGGGRSFYGGGAIRNFYSGGGSGFPFSYEKKAVEYVPYYIDDQLKRGGARAFGAPSFLRQPWYAEKRAGGRTFPIEDMDESKEKRMIDEMSRFYS